MGKKIIAQGQVSIVAQSDAITIQGTRNNYIVSADKDGRIANAVSVTTIIQAIRDGVQLNVTIGNLPTVIGCTLSKSGSSVTIVFNVGVSLAEHGIIDIPISVEGQQFSFPFSFAKVRTGATGASGQSGVDANLLDWVKDWNSNKTVIDSQSVITPKIFTGVKNANGTVSGIAIGKFDLKTINASGSVVTSNVNGIFAFKDGYTTFSVENNGDTRLGRNNQFVRYNAATGKIEFGSDVSLNWTSAISLAKSDAIATASRDATTKADSAKNSAISSAATDASSKAENAKNQAITSASTDATTKANKAKVDAIVDATSKINAIQIGGSNLLNNSGNWRAEGWNGGFSSHGGGYTIDSTKLYNGKTTLKTIVGTGLQHPWLKLENGVEYTFSAIVLCNESIIGTGSFPLHCQAGKSNVSQSKITFVKFDTSVVANQWKKISITFKLTGDADSLKPFFYRGVNGATQYWIANLKLERGNVATDWAPSTSDIGANISDAEQAGKNAQQVADLLTKKANDEKWSSKLTYIDSNGIFTGTLSANIVNTIKINASQITAGVIDAARINVTALKASLITAGNIEALTLNVVRGKIGGWSIDGDSIFSGAKNNTANAFATAAGAITIGSNGIRGFKWRLESGGSGALAGGNIAWDVSGNVTFGDNVTLNWTNAANNALNSAKTYADTKKSEAISSAATDTANKVNTLSNVTLPKLTQITSTGIYTGSLTASQITAGTIHVDRIAAGSINSTKLDAVSIKANIINTAYINGLSCTFDKGKIGGWTIGTDHIIIGNLGKEGSTPIQLRSVPTGSGSWFSGAYRPYGISMVWWQNNNAGHLIFGQICASGNTVKTGFLGIQMMAWDSSEYFCLSANTTKIGSKEVYNRIAGWAFDNTRIWKNNVSLGADGGIHNGSLWKLNNDGSGQVANGNISWNASGAVVFAASVSLNWTNAVNAAKTELQNSINTVKVDGLIYCRGTAMNRNGNRILIVSGKTIYNTGGGRGLQLTVIKRADLSVVSNVHYDIYGDVVKRTELAKALDALNDTTIVVLTSNDAVLFDTQLASSMARCGGSGIILISRNPYALVGIPGIGKGKGIEEYSGVEATAPYAEITTRVVNGTPIGFNSTQGLALGNAAVAQAVADAITKKSNDEKWGTKLTHISDTGIFTGTLSANVVNAIRINATQITAGTISADRIAAGSLNSTKLDANSIKANIINVGYINGLTCDFVRGKIGGWSIGADTITIGSIGTVGATPIQIRSSSVGSGYWYQGSYKPYGLCLTWLQNSNAGHIVFGQIAASGNTVKTGYLGIQMMAWDNTEYFCLSANTLKVGVKEVYNRIAGWAFDSTRIWKNNVSLGADGGIYNGSLWKLNNDGSGQLANGNIVWNGAGVVSFGASVSLNWTNAANNALASAKTYADTKKNEAISAAATDATNKAEAAKELAQAMAFGKMLYRDPTFYNGNNGMAVYNNSNNGTVTVTRVGDVNAPNDSKQVLVIKNTGGSSPHCGGFHWSTPTAYRKVLIARIIAKIPTGRSIAFHTNSIGTGGSQKWLTPVTGTGDWYEYICKVACGTATFQPTNYFAITGAVGSATAPVEWRIAYATVFDITSTEKYTTTIDVNGVYTGTVRANQVLIDSALVVGGSSYNGSISVRDASNNVKVTLDRNGINAVGGVIGGWTIAATQISKNSVVLGADGTISNGTKWKLGNDGSGYVANSNLTWTAAGQVTLKGKIEATEGIIGGFTISGNKLINRATDSSLQFDSLSGSSSLVINGSTSTLLSLRADTARTGIYIQTYAAGAKGIQIIANAGSTYAIESHGPHKFGQRAGEVWNAPGVLFSAIVKNSSTLYNQWGNGLTVTSFYKKSTGVFILTHDLGHTQYIVLATPYWDSGANWHSNCYIRVERMTTTQLEMRVVNSDNGGYVETCFSFAIIGRNRL